MTRPGSISCGKVNFRLAKPEDLPLLVEKLGAAFFAESGMGAFTAFDPERAADQMAEQVRRGETVIIIPEIDGEPVGVAGYYLSHIYTVDPIAYLWILYVEPKHRRGPIGRMLIWLLFDLARNDDAVAFLSTVPESRGLCNLLRRVGCLPMGGAFSRHIPKERI
jgi:GNAT superfamily N-acetyltransferase